MAGKHVARESKLGFTNKLAIVLALMLIAGLAGGFMLAVLSIKYQYTGALACWTIVFTPIGTAISLVIGAIVNKSKRENTGANGDGIIYATTMKRLENELNGSDNSPSI